MRVRSFFLVCCLLAACSGEPVVNDQMRHIEGPLPADFSGSWERNYARGDDISGAFYDAVQRLPRNTPDQGFGMPPVAAQPSPRDVDNLIALARLAEDITRPDVLTIYQTEHEVRVEREDDFAMQCAFYNGVAKSIVSEYGMEICGWDGRDLVSNLILPGGLQITHRFAVSGDRSQLRVTTTVASTTARVPFTMNRFYTRFERLPPDYNCIETLSMKRVCGTGPVVRP
jgi:hypothetical protein